MTNQEAAEILERAAEVIERHGWTQGLIVSESGKVCAFGAICCAIEKVEPLQFYATRESYEGGGRVAGLALGALVRAGLIDVELHDSDRQDGEYLIADWNDNAHGASQEMVASGLRSAAAQLTHQPERVGQITIEQQVDLVVEALDWLGS